MINKKLTVFHFHNGSGGGVLSVIQNLLKYSQSKEIENHVIYTINRDKDNVKDFIIPKLAGAATEQVFYYSPRWNFYFTCKQLAKLLPDKKALIIAHDWLELGMSSNIGLQNPVVFFLHGNYDYYYNLAKKHSNVIDNFICISKPIYHKLNNYLPGRKNAILQRYFPVPQIQSIAKENATLNIYYCVRNLEETGKRFLLLPQIDKLLQKAGITVSWTVIGRGGEELNIRQGLQSLRNLTYHSNLKNEEVLSLLAKQDVFVLPSQNEGLPVALVEAMKAGLVPLVSNWEGATEELIIEGESGFYIDWNDAEKYAATTMFRWP